MKKLALVLSGGGFKGAFQLGALQQIKNDWSLFASDRPPLHFDIVAGVSVGALNGFLVAAGRYHELQELWDRIKLRGVCEIYTSDFIETQVDENDPHPKLKMKVSMDTIKKRFPNTFKNFVWRLLMNKQAIVEGVKKDFANFRSFASNQPLREKLTSLNITRKNITDVNTIYKCGYVSLSDGLYYSVRHNDFIQDLDLINGVIASTAMPLVWEPVPEINSLQDAGTNLQKNLVDGGIRNCSPLGDVINEINGDSSDSEYLIVIINCSSGKIETEDFDSSNIAKIAARSLIDIAMSEIFNNDIKEFMDKNYMVYQMNLRHPGERVFDYDLENHRQGKQLKHFSAVIIQPNSDELGDPLVSNKLLMENRVAHGIRQAEKEIARFLNNNQSDLRAVS
jgi:NTE family protein